MYFVIARIHRWLNRLRCVCMAVALLCASHGLAATAIGSFIPVPIPDQLLNNDLRTWSSGSSYSPILSGSQKFDHVPFEMRTNASGNNIIWATTQNAFLIGLTTYNVTTTLNTDTYGTRAVYTLINTAYSGVTGTKVGAISFIASDGTSYTVDLQIGINVRDHFISAKPSASYVTANVLGTDGGAHLDMQRFDLPASFATKRLTQIRFTMNGNSLIGIPFLAGLTLDAMAEPIAKYTMEELTLWNGSANELKDTAGARATAFDGRAIGNPVPVQAFTNPARVGAANGTCQYAQLNGPLVNGGAFQINNLPVNTQPSAQNSVSFWMYWNGADTVVPLGWKEYKLIFRNGLFGFDAGDGRLFARSSAGLANGWRHISAVFTNIDVESNKLYIDGVAQSLTMSGTQRAISFFNPDNVTTNVSPPATWGTGAPPAGWFTDNPSRIIEVNPPAVYGASGTTSNNVIELEANVGDYNLYTTFTPDAGEDLTLSVDFAARSGYTTGTNSSIDILINNVVVGRLNNQSVNSTVFQNRTIKLGIADGTPIKLEFRSVDRNSYGGLLTNIQVFRNRSVATASLYIGGVGDDNNHRFIGLLDEIKVYKGAMSQAQVNADLAETHLCQSLHHVRLDHNGSGLTCAPAQIAVRGCSNADLNGTCTPSVIPFAGTVVAERNGQAIASVPFAIPAGANFTQVELNVPTEQITNFTVVNYSVPPYGNPQSTCWNGATNSASCQFAFNDAGLMVANSLNGAAVNIPTQVAGVNSNTYYLRAVQKNTSTGACQAALTGDQDIEFGYVCNNPTTCSSGNLMKVGKSTVDGTIIESSNFFPGSANANGFANAAPIRLTFDSNGNAPLWLNYYDAGQTTLYMRKTLPSGATLNGNTNAFVTKPHRLTISDVKTTGNVANPVATSASGPRFVKAGEPFQATVNAFAANGWSTRNFGRETAPVSVRVDAFLEAPVGGNSGVMSGNITSTGSFTNGMAVLSGLRWSEVGIMRLLPVIADNNYLGTGSVQGIFSDNIGRFYPDHFTLTPGSDSKGCNNQFTYYGQDGLTTAFTMTAKNVNQVTTQNYSGSYGATSFMKFNTSDRSRYAFSVNTSLPLLASATPTSGTWTNGVGTILAKHIVAKASSPTAPADLTWMAKPTDDDGVTSATAMPISSATPFRDGRLFLQSQHGSELLSLPLRVEAQYWDGYGYTRNTQDRCSVLPVTGLSMKNYHGNLNACETRLSAVTSMVNGVQSFRLSPPGVTAGVPNSGSVDIELNVNAVTSSDKVCVGSAEANATSLNLPWMLQSVEPVGRATFGRNRVPMIYMRENF